MNNKIWTFLFLAAFSFWACNSEKPKAVNISADTTESLTYEKMWKMVFGDTDGEGIEWHGEALDESAKPDLAFESSAPCGKGNCGKVIILKNNAIKPVEAIVQSNFSIPDFPPYTALKLTVPANGEATVGCSHLCLNEEPVTFSPKIVGAIYLE